MDLEQVCRNLAQLAQKIADLGGAASPCGTEHQKGCQCCEQGPELVQSSLESQEAPCGADWSDYYCIGSGFRTELGIAQKYWHWCR